MMARTNHVKAFRGQRKCQWPLGDGGWRSSLCGVLAKDHFDDELAEGIPNHSFTQAALTCEFCGKDIEIGMAYKFMVQKTGPRSSRRRNRHETCREWRPSEKTQSPVLQVLFGAEEAASDALSGLVEPGEASDSEDVQAELETILADYAEAISEAAEMRNEAGANMEEGFGHPTEMSEQLQSDGEELESFQYEIEGTAVETFDTDSLEDDDDALSTWFADQVEAVDGVIGSMPL